MFGFRQRGGLLGPLLFIVYVSITTIFFMDFYKNVKKYYRMEEYKALIDDLQENMGLVEMLVYKTDQLILDIKKVLVKKQRKHTIASKSYS